MPKKQAEKKFRAVKFLRRFADYDKDTVATFDEPRAEAMVKGGVAEFVQNKRRQKPECPPSPENAS